jgi:hypothetical protein
VCGCCNTFDVHGSVLLGNIYVLFQVQLDVRVFFISLIDSSTFFGCYLHPSSGAQLQRTAIGVCTGLVCYSIGAGTAWDTGYFTLLAQSVTVCIPSSGTQLQRTAIGVCMGLLCYSIGAGTAWETGDLKLLARSVTDCN